MIKIQATFSPNKNNLTFAKATGLPNDFLRKVFGTDPFSVIQFENMFGYLNSKGVTVSLDGDLPFIELEEDSLELAALRTIAEIIQAKVKGEEEQVADIEEVLKKMNSFRGPYEKYMLDKLRSALTNLATCLYVALSNEGTRAKLTKNGRAYLAGIGNLKNSVLSEIDFSAKAGE